jgi:hypothetical protein
MPRPAFQNQRNQLAPFSYAQASGPELPSLIGSINQQYDSQNAAMDMQSKMADHDQKMQLQSWQMENGDAYGQLLTELDPSSPDFDQQLSQIDRRAFTLPGFDKVLGAKVRERDASNATEQRRLMNSDRRRSEYVGMAKGLPSAMQLDIIASLDAGTQDVTESLLEAGDEWRTEQKVAIAAAAHKEDLREESVAAEAASKRFTRADLKSYETKLSKLEDEVRKEQADINDNIEINAGRPSKSKSNIAPENSKNLAAAKKRLEAHKATRPGGAPSDPATTQSKAANIIDLVNGTK